MFKKKNRLKITKIVTIFLALMLLVACGSAKTGQQEPATTNTQQAEKPESEKQPVEEIELIVSTAVSLTDAVEEMKTVFEKENEGIKLAFNFGSSGKLAEQISQGAPADLFLSASQKDMNTLEEQNLILTDSRFDFASNVLVAIAAKDSELALPSLEDLTDLAINHIAIGHTESTPLGRYAKESLEKLNIWDKLEEKMVYGSDVRQVLSFVEAGNAEIGILYNTDALSSEQVKVLLAFDPELHAPVNYPAAMIESSKHPEAAQKFLDFINSSEGKSILEAHGFITK